MGRGELGSDRARGAPPAVALVGNPNALVYPTDARRALGEPNRPWAELVREASEATSAFHRSTGLPVLTGFAVRAVSDRKHQRSVHLLFAVLVDGPATKNQLALLDSGVWDVFPAAGPAAIERAPANGVLASLWRDGHCWYPWREGEHGLWQARLEGVGDAIESVGFLRSRAGPGDVPTELAPAVGVPAPYGPAEQHEERLRLAFALHYTRAILRADGVVKERERAFLDTLFPEDLLAEAALHDEEAARVAFELSRTELPGRLGHHDKLALLGLFFSACYSDGAVDAREMRVLKDAGLDLGLTREEVVTYLRKLW